jgi:hypothetical protein
MNKKEIIYLVHKSSGQVMKTDLDWMRSQSSEKLQEYAETNKELYLRYKDDVMPVKGTGWVMPPKEAVNEDGKRMVGKVQQVCDLHIMMYGGYGRRNRRIGKKSSSNKAGIFHYQVVPARMVENGTIMPARTIKHRKTSIGMCNR